MTFLKKIKSVLATLGKSGIERRMTESKSLSYKCSILFSVLYKNLRALVRVSDRHAQVVKSRIYDVADVTLSVLVCRGGLCFRNDVVNPGHLFCNATLA